MDQLIGAFRTREAVGIVPTQLAVDMILSELDDMLPQIPDTSLAGTLGAYVSFVTRVQRIDGLDGTTRRTLLADARDAISTSLIPAYRYLGEYVSTLADYLLEATGRPEGLSGSLRYDSYPGQACAYDIGYLKLLELRQRAMDELGEAFDLKEFHRVILLNGAIPLAVLEGVVDDWLAEKTETD